MGTNPTLRIDNYSNTAGDSPNFNFITARGTSTTPLATQSGDNLGQFAAAGYNGSAFPSSRVKVSFLATENWSADGQRHGDDLCDHQERHHRAHRADAH